MSITIKLDFITEPEEQSLITMIDSQPWSNAISRRTQHYGFEYTYKTVSDSLKNLGEIPDWLNVKHILTDNKINQVIINEYIPGQGIGAHRDSPIFGDTIIALSLGNDIIMTLDNVDTLIKRRSLMTFDRSVLHGITARKTDVINQKRVVRGRRISITYRYYK